MSHQVNYKGYVVIFENGNYWLAVNPKTRYKTFEECQREIDKVVLSFESTIDNLSVIMKRNRN